jgi:hypothetical protein
MTGPGYTIEWHGAQVANEIKRAEARGLALWAEAVLTESNAHVPIDEATLERSGVAQVDGDESEGAVSYDTPYAVRQHEELDYRHAPGRTAKYLENALNSTRDSGPELVATEIRRATGGR